MSFTMQPVGRVTPIGVGGTGRGVARPGLVRPQVTPLGAGVNPGGPVARPMPQAGRMPGFQRVGGPLPIRGQGLTPAGRAIMQLASRLAQR